jgi:hypothetical protein
MQAMREIWTVTALNLSSLRLRPAATLVVLFGIAAAVGVLTSVLSMSTGLLHTMASTGREDRVIIESHRGLGEEALAKILAAPVSSEARTASRWRVRKYRISPSERRQPMARRVVSGYAESAQPSISCIRSCGSRRDARLVPHCAS